MLLATVLWLPMGSWDPRRFVHSASSRWRPACRRQDSTLHHSTHSSATCRECEGQHEQADLGEDVGVRNRVPDRAALAWLRQGAGSVDMIKIQVTVLGGLGALVGYLFAGPYGAA